MERGFQHCMKELKRCWNCREVAKGAKSWWGYLMPLHFSHNFGGSQLKKWWTQEGREDSEKFCKNRLFIYLFIYCDNQLLDIKCSWSIPYFIATRQAKVNVGQAARRDVSLISSQQDLLNCGVNTTWSSQWTETYLNVPPWIYSFARLRWLKVQLEDLTR